MQQLLTKEIIKFLTFVRRKGFDIDPVPTVRLNTKHQSQDVFQCLTGSYDPEQGVITLYTHGRHPKDVMRTFAHELVHHIQQIKLGTLTSIDTKDVNSSTGLMKLEKHAYTQGNILLRQFFDEQYK